MAQISVIRYEDILKSHRFDAEFFKPEYLSLLNVSSNRNIFKSFKKLNLTVDASAFYPSIEPLYNTGDLPFLRVANVDTSIDYSSAVTIPNEILKDFKTIKLGKKGDIIITKGGSVARIGYLNKTCALSRDLIIINSSILNPRDSKYLFFYLLSNFTNKLLLRSSSLTAQPHLTLLLVRELPIFYPDEKFRDKISVLFDQSILKKNQSGQLYKEAENLLLEELGLLNFKPDHHLNFETTKSKIDYSKRFDSEYYQPKYDTIITHIENYKKGFDIAKNIFKFNKKNFFPKDDEFYYYIPLSKVSNSGEIEIPEKELGINLPTRARRKVKVGEIILSSIEGSLETSALINEDHQGFIVSNGFYVFSSDKINSETLLVLFKSQIMIELLKQISKGAILGGYDLTAFEKNKIPLIEIDVQKKISDKIIESFNLRKESKELLEKAKKMVEEEIEKEAKK